VFPGDALRPRSCLMSPGAAIRDEYDQPGFPSGHFPADLFFLKAITHSKTRQTVTPCNDDRTAGWWQSAHCAVITRVTTGEWPNSRHRFADGRHGGVDPVAPFQRRCPNPFSLKAHGDFRASPESRRQARGTTAAILPRAVAPSRIRASAVPALRRREGRTPATAEVCGDNETVENLPLNHWPPSSSRQLT
jgi:hypothetical protein